MSDVLAQRLLKLRQTKGIYQKDIAAYLGVTSQAYSLYEKGSRNPDPNTLKKIANYYEVPLDYLLGNDDIDIKAKYDNNRKKVLDIIDKTGENITINFKNFINYTDDDIEKIKEDIELVLALHKKKKEGK